MVLRNLPIKFFYNYLLMNNKRYNALKFYNYKINGKIFSFIKKPDDIIIKKIEQVSSDNYLILDLKEEIVCDMINQIVNNLINGNLNCYQKINLENNLINLLLSNNWLRETNWIKFNFNKIKKNYNNEFYDIITFIYYNFYSVI